MKKSARNANKVSAAGLAAFGLLGLLTAPVGAQTYDKIELEVAGPLGEKILGSASAPVTVIEYTSLTCPRCRRFHQTVLPMLRSKYIDTGKVRFIFREFSLDPLATGASMLARCAPDDQFFPLVDVFLDSQRDWTAESPLAQLFEVARQAGLSKESFDACLRDNRILNGVTFVRDRGQQKFGISDLPTLFVNGVKLVGDVDLAAIEKAAGLSLR